MLMMRKTIDVENRIAGLLIQKQRSEYENKLESLKSVNDIKRKSAAVFTLKANFLGDNKSKQEAVVIEDPINKELLFDAGKIQEFPLTPMGVLAPVPAQRDTLIHF